MILLLVIKVLSKSDFFKKKASYFRCGDANFLLNWRAKWHLSLSQIKDGKNTTGDKTLWTASALWGLME
jgi:hypothetical protein